MPSRRASAKAPEPETPAQPTAAASDAHDVAPDAPPELVFERLRSFAGEASPGLLAPLEGGRIVERGDGHLTIAVPTLFSAKRLNHKRAQLEAACSRFFGSTIRVEIESADSEDAAAADSTAEGRESARDRRQRALTHPSVRRALEVLEGEIVEIRPVGGPR